MSEESPLLRSGQFRVEGGIAVVKRDTGKLIMATGLGPGTFQYHTMSTTDYSAGQDRPF
jgi:hypothetical protein